MCFKGNIKEQGSQGSCLRSMMGKRGHHNSSCHNDLQDLEGKAPLLERKEWWPVQRHHLKQKEPQTNGSPPLRQC